MLSRLSEMRCAPLKQARAKRLVKVAKGATVTSAPARIVGGSIDTTLNYPPKM